MYTQCLVFVTTILLAVSDVRADEADDGQILETKSTIASQTKATASTCYGASWEISCTKKKTIIIGSVIGSFFVLLVGLYLYTALPRRRKKQKGSSATEESRPSGDQSRTTFDVEKGTSKGDPSDFKYHGKSDEASVLRNETSQTFGSHQRP